MRTRQKKLPPQVKRKCGKRLKKNSIHWGRKFLFTGILLLAFAVVGVLYNYKPDLSSFLTGEVSEGAYRSRTLKSVEEGSGHSVQNETHAEEEKGAPWEKCEFEIAHGRYGWLPIYCFGVFVLFVAIAIICDDFFVPSLEAISEKLDLSEDVAGATFMAAGSSAPELFTSVAAVGTDSDVGIGTIVGSAMFNILIIVALSAVLAGQTLTLDWRPLMRDATVYGTSIILFIVFAWDARFEWYEALILLLVYIGYIVLMKFNPYLMKLLSKMECWWCRNGSRVEPVDHSSEENHPGSANTRGEAEMEANQDHEHSHGSHQHASNHSLHDEHKHRFVHSHRGELAGSFANRRRSTVHHSDHELHRHLHHLTHTNHDAERGVEEPNASASSEQQAKSSQSHSHSSQSQMEEEEAVTVLIPCLPPIRASPPDIELAREEGQWGWVKYVLKWILFVLSFPFMVAFTWTIPNCSENRKWYVVTGSFLMCILWIAFISFGMVTLVAKCGCILNVDQFTMGLIVVAIGTSVPDALSSILVARDGFGDMAVSNAIGSNVFDINLGLGLPFLIRTLINREGFPLLPEEELNSLHDIYTVAPHAKFGFLLLFILLMTLVTFTVFRFRLNSGTGLCFVVIYALFLTYAFVQDAACKGGRYC